MKRCEKIGIQSALFDFFFSKKCHQKKAVFIRNLIPQQTLGNAN
jgi:hypothetical protein